MKAPSKISSEEEKESTDASAQEVDPKGYITCSWPCYQCFYRPSLIAGPAGPTGATGPAGASYTPDLLSAADCIGQTAEKTSQIEIGSAISHVSGSDDYILNQTGTYLAVYHADVTSRQDAVPPFSASIKLTVNDSFVPGSLAETTIAQAGATVSLSAAAIIPISSAPATVQLAAGNGVPSNSSIILLKVN